MSSRRVLIIEDEPHIVLSLEYLLERDGFETATAADGERGLAMVRELRLDLMLPRLDGYQVCQAIKSDPELAPIPIIVLSAKGQEVEVLKGLSLGAAQYITKPFGNAEILEAVRAVLEPRT
jgi:two-component system, OmpR family, alkaline phosphatase synthesis response regulator PhoP